MENSNPRTHGLIFSEVSIPLLVNGSKTETRRRAIPHNSIISDKRAKPRVWSNLEPESFRLLKDGFVAKHPALGVVAVRPVYQPGDRFYVREKWAKLPAYESVPTTKLSKIGEPSMVTYWASSDRERYMYAWKSPLIMPRRLARLHGTIESVRAERLLDISPESAIRETGMADDAFGARARFLSVWQELHAHHGGTDENPIVWVIRFALDYTVSFGLDR